MQLDELPVDENGKPQAESGEADSPVYWVDEKPFAISLEPAEINEENLAEAGTTSVYWIDEKPYDVSLQPVSKEEAEKLSENGVSEIVKAGDTYYRLQMAPAATSPDSEKSISESSASAIVGADSDQVTAKSGSEERPVPDNDPFGTDSVKEEPAAVAWVNGKPYAVSVKPYEKPAAGSENKPDTEKSVIPVTVIDELDKKTAVFQTEGKQYEIKAEEIDPEKHSVEGTAQPIVWIDETPLHVTLDPVEADSFNIVLESVPEEELPYLYEEHFGKAYTSNEKSAEQDAVVPEPADSSAETDENPESEPEKESWFVNVFHDIFGGSPTETPTPQVTLIAMEPTNIPKGPTATPIIVRMAPTSTPRGPMRLDDGEDYGSSGTDQKASVSVVNDSDNSVSRAKDSSETGSVQQSGEQKGSGDEPMITILPTSGADRSSVSVPVTVVENNPEPDSNPDPALDSNPVRDPAPAGNPEQIAAEPTPEELPHTGMAESWNIPSMIALLFGLLLVIIGVRRLRMTR